MMRASRFVALCVVLAAFAAGANAQGIAWEDLSEAQRELLAPQQQNWSQLDPSRQEQIARGADRFLEMNRGDRAAARDRFQVWQGMTPEQRAAARERYQEFRRLPSGERAQLLDTYRRYRMMPPERRNELRQRFRQLTPEQRRGLRDQRLRQRGGLNRP